MHVIKNNGIIQRIIYESSNKKIGICGYDKAAIALERILDNLGVTVNYFLIINNSYDDYEDERVINIYELMYEIEDIFVVEPHFERIFIKYKKALLDIGYIEMKDFVHIFSSTIRKNTILENPDCIDVNLGLLWMQDENGFTVFGSLREDAYTIVTLGGSTTYAKWLVYAKCWSELLYQKLYDEGKKNVRIMCGGAPAFDSTQELIKYLRDVVPMKPNMVLSYSGVNDVVESHGDINIYGAGYPFAFPRLMRKLEEFKRDTQEEVNLYLGRKSEQSTEDVWILNKKIMHYIAEETGIIFYAFLEPMIFYGNYIVDKELEFVLDDYQKNEHYQYAFAHMGEFCKNVIDKTKDIDYIQNFTGIFDGCTKLFVDNCHVNEWGNEIIADKIYEFIKKEIW